MNLRRTSRLVPYQGVRSGLVISCKDPNKSLLGAIQGLMARPGKQPTLAGNCSGSEGNTPTLVRQQPSSPKGPRPLKKEYLAQGPKQFTIPCIGTQMPQLTGTWTLGGT